MSIKSVFSKIINAGVEESMPFAEQFNIRNSNRLGLFGFPTPILLAFIFTGEHYYLPSIIACSLLSLFILFMPYLNSKKWYSLANYSFFFAGSLNTLMFNWVFGPKAGFIHCIIPFFIIIYAGFRHRRQFIVLNIYLCLLIAAYMLISYYHRPLFIMEDYDLAYAATLVAGILYSSLVLIAIKVEINIHIKTIFFKNKELETTKAVLEVKNKELTDSINYAKQIQYALLANKDLLHQNMSEHFVLFKPKSVVSGDFYWAAIKNGDLYFALCDSTGHGVPGAFMSLLNISFLNEAIIERGISEPNEIFNYVRARLIGSITETGLRDGMDGVLLRISFLGPKLKIVYAGANNAPIAPRDAVLQKLQHDRMPVGKSENSASFTNYEFELNKGEIFYLCTDGYADQFGGSKEKKFMTKQLLFTLQELSESSLSVQKEVLNKKFEQWRGNLEQVDDVSVIGFRA
jgi:serine phosphatase RsbU (regulator of sigma subunit)